jgi:CheY-like chemotaxis protein
MPRHPYPYRVLVVDDDDGAALLTASLFTGDARVEVVGRARNGREALTLAAAASPDVVLMDLEMPVLNGIDATRRLRETGSQAVIIIVTGSEEAGAVGAALEAGADGVVRKPPTREALMDAIEAANRT